jgi:ABC-type uncharacterized transport system substrate-binding protein
MKQKQFFADFELNGDEVLLESVDKVFSIAQDERLQLEMFVSFDLPILKESQVLHVGVYDEQYYYDIMSPIEDTVSVADANEEIQCSISFYEDKEKPYYFDQFYPVKAVLEFKK